MNVGLLEHLRCPNPHEDTHLVVAAARTHERHVLEGTLGCATCGAEFIISGGVAHFSDAVAAAPAVTPSAEEAMRLAALLELTDARGFALLCGSWGAHADQVQRLSDTPLVLVNPPAAALEFAVAAILQVGDALPLATGTARAAAYDRTLSHVQAEAVVRSVRGGGRLVAPVGVPVPDGAREIARDERAWVAELAAASPPGLRLVEIQRSRSAEP